MNYRIKFLRTFKDGNIFPKEFKTGEVTDVTERELTLLRSSGALVEIQGRVTPPPVPAEPQEEPKLKKKAAH